MKLTKEQIEDYLASQEAKDIITILAYMLDQTPSEVDNQVVDQISDYADLFAEKLKQVESENPTGKDAVHAVLRLAQEISKKTHTKWDDIIVNFTAKVTGADKK